MQTLNDLITNSFNFGDVSEEEKNKIIVELADIAIERSVMRALDKMTDEDVKNFENTIGENAHPKTVFAYLETSVPSFIDIIREEVLRLQALSSSEK